MKSTSTMTVDECRDELAVLRCPGGHRYDDFAKTHYWKSKISADWSRDHPIPATLDEAAKLLEGWNFHCYRLVGQMGLGENGPWKCEAWREHDEDTLESSGTTELEARFRLRVEVERSLREGGKEEQK